MSSRPIETRLERALYDLGPRVAFPPEPNLAPRVIAAIQRQPTSRTAAPARARRRAARAFAFGMAALLAATVTLTLSPATREAVADFLGIGGVRIETVPGPLPTPTTAAGENLALGMETTLEDARAAVDFDVLVPTVSEFADPDDVYLAAFPPGGRVSFTYRAGGSLPEANETGLGLLITEFQGTVEGELSKKLAVQQQVRPTLVNGSPALWVRGAHTVFFLDAEGEQRSDTLRLSANALIWTNGETTLRLESALSLEESLRIAESMR